MQTLSLLGQHRHHLLLAVTGLLTTGLAPGGAGGAGSGGAVGAAGGAGGAAQV